MTQGSGRGSSPGTEHRARRSGAGTHNRLAALRHASTRLGCPRHRLLRTRAAPRLHLPYSMAAPACVLRLRPPLATPSRLGHASLGLFPPSQLGLLPARRAGDPTREPGSKLRTPASNRVDNGPARVLPLRPSLLVMEQPFKTGGMRLVWWKA